MLDRTAIKVADASWNLTTKRTVSAGESWHWADFGTYVVLVNGTGLWERHYSIGAYSAPSTSEFPTAKTLCALRGQLMLGNIQSSWYDCNSRYAVWSAIGEDTFVPDWKNEAGYRDMEIGEIYKVLPLGDEAAIYYGHEGIAMLYPSKQTFGYKKISDVGVAGRDCAAGIKEHVFISHDGRLYTVSNEGEVRMGYREWLNTLTLADIVMSHDPDLGDIYITDGSNGGFMLSKSGLTELVYYPTWINRIDGSLVGIFATASSTDLLLELEYQDFSLAAMKSLEFVELSLVSDGTIYVAVDDYYTKGQTERAGSWKRVNDSNFVYHGGTANMHKIRIKSSDATSFNLDQIVFSYKLSDNRIQNQLQTLSSGGRDVG